MGWGTPTKTNPWVGSMGFPPLSQSQPFREKEISVA